MPIRSFKCSDSAALYEGSHPKRFRSIESVAERKLQMLDAAEMLQDLRSPLCFVWAETGPDQVEIVDYHD